MLQQRLQDVNALVKIKNPSLLLQLQRAPAPPVRLSSHRPIELQFCCDLSTALPTSHARHCVQTRALLAPQTQTTTR